MAHVQLRTIYESENQFWPSFALKKNGLIIVVAKLQTGFDEKKLHTLFLDKEIRDISAIQTISRVNRTAKYKNDCKIVDFSYNNVNVQNIKDAFEHFSDVVVSDFDPFGDKRVLGILLTALNKSDTYDKFINVFIGVYKDPIKTEQPESYLDFESSLKKYIEANPQRTADTKAKAAQYFTILNRIEFVIALDAKYSEPSFLFFWRKFNTLYNMLHRSEDVKDPIEVYFDNQIGMVEVVAEEAKKKNKKPTEIETGFIPGPGGQYDILEIIAARNEQEEKIGSLIFEFESKISDFFEYVKTSTEGERLIVKIKSYVSENEIYDDFSKIYRRYRALYRSKVGDYFFKETEDLVNKLSDDFEAQIRSENSWLEQEIVSGYMYLGTDDFELAQFAFEAYMDFAVYLGFEVKDKGEFFKGSWFRKGIELLSPTKNSDEAKRLYEKTQKAIELAAIEKTQSEVNKNNSEAIATFLNSVKDIPQAATRIGSLIVLKVLVNDVPQVISTVLTTEQLIAIEKQPVLMSKPGDLLSLINNDRDKLN